MDASRFIKRYAKHGSVIAFWLFVITGPILIVLSPAAAESDLVRIAGEFEFVTDYSGVWIMLTSGISCLFLAIVAAGIHSIISGINALGRQSNTETPRYRK